MPRLNLVIFDPDADYLRGIANYIIENSKKFYVTAISSEESIIRYISNQENPLDILLFNPTLWNDELEKSDFKLKIALTDGMFDDFKDYRTIGKYQKTENIINSILLAYSEEVKYVDFDGNGDKNTYKIGVYSPVGGCGKTTISILIAKYLSEEGKKVFYLNYERLTSVNELFGRCDGGNMSDVFFAVKTEDENLGLKLLSVKNTEAMNKISFIKPPESALEFNEISIYEHQKIINELDKLGEFDTIVMDFDSGLTNDKLEMLDMCDVIIVPFSSDNASINKIKNLQRELELRDDLRSIFIDMKLVANKTDMKAMNYIMENGIDADINISFSDDLADINTLLYTNSDEFIKPLAEMIY